METGQNADLKSLAVVSFHDKTVEFETYQNSKQLFFLPPATEIFNFTRINRRWQFALSPNYVVIVIL